MYKNQIMLIFNTDCLLKKNIHVLKTYMEKVQGHNIKRYSNHL